MLPKAAQTFHGQRGRSQFACRVVTGEVGLTNPHPTRIAVREHDDEPDVAVPTVRLLGSNGLSDQGVASARQSNLGRERCLNVLQSVVHSKEGAGLEHCPSGNFFANAAWLCCAVLAHDLVRWTARLGEVRPDGELIVARSLRTRLLALPGRLVNRSGAFVLRLPNQWPWATTFTSALDRVRALPLVT